MIFEGSLLSPLEFKIFTWDVSLFDIVKKFILRCYADNIVIKCRCLSSPRWKQNMLIFNFKVKTDLENMDSKGEWEEERNCVNWLYHFYLVNDKCVMLQCSTCESTLGPIGRSGHTLLGHTLSSGPLSHTIHKGHVRLNARTYKTHNTQYTIRFFCK